MTADLAVLDRIIDRLVRTLSAGGPDQLRSPFTVSEIVQSLVPYRTYRNELGVDTLQEYEQAILEMLAGERGWLVCDPDTVSVIQKELSSPDPDTGLLRRLHTAEVRMGAIRMPVSTDLKAPIARASEVGPAAARNVMSDAVAIGAVMDREDAERAESTSSASELATSDDDATDGAVKTPAAKKTSRKTPRSSATIAATPAVVTTPASDATATTTPAVTAPATVNSAAPSLPSVSDLPNVARVEPATTATVHAVQGVTVASAQTLSRITPLSVPSVFGDPIDFRGVRHAPVDIGGVIFLFGMVARELGFHVEAMSSGFPRCEAKRQMSPGKWTRLRIDFELDSRQFRDAGRNPGACDLIVCWRDTWPDRPASLEILALDRALLTLQARG